MNEKIETNRSMATPPLLYGVHDAALKLSMSPVSIRKLIRKNRLQRVDNFRKILIPEASLQKFAQISQ